MRLYVIRLTYCFTHISVERLSVLADHISVLPQFQQRRKIIAVTVFGTNNTFRQLKKLTAFSFRNQTKGFLFCLCPWDACFTARLLPPAFSGDSQAGVERSRVLLVRDTCRGLLQLFAWPPGFCFNPYLACISLLIAPFTSDFYCIVPHPLVEFHHE